MKFVIQSELYPGFLASQTCYAKLQMTTLGWTITVKDFAMHYETRQILYALLQMETFSLQYCNL